MAWEAYQTEGIILRSRESGEADRVYTVYTREYGSISLFAKSVRLEKSKLKSALTLFAHIKGVFVVGKDNYRLTDAEVVEKFTFIEEDYWRYNLAVLVTRSITEVIAGEEADLDVWNLVLEVFRAINSPELSRDQESVLLYIFQVKLLSHLGYLPEERPVIVEELRTAASFSSFKILTKEEKSTLRDFLRIIYSYVSNKSHTFIE